MKKKDVKHTWRRLYDEKQLAADENWLGEGRGGKTGSWVDGCTCEVPFDTGLKIPE